MMHFTLGAFVCLAFYVHPAYADENDDFINNLLTDLAPLIALFGEKVAMQFMSQSMGLADSIALAMAPIGVITIIVSAIRVGGPTWLKAVVGRARESLSAAEIELMSSTSTEVCELWNGRNVVRCQGSAKIWQFICLVPEDMKKPCKRPFGESTFWKVKCMELEAAVAEADGPMKITEISSFEKLKKYLREQKEKLTAKKKSQNSLECGEAVNNTRNREEPSHGPEIPKSKNTGKTESDDRTVLVIREEVDDAPNVSLNCYDRTSRKEIIFVAIIGTILQGAVLVFSGFVSLQPSISSRFQKNGKPVQSYAFPLAATGIIILTIGILLCGMVVEQCSSETHYIVNPNSPYKSHRLYTVWLQKGSRVNDQDFKPFAFYPAKERSFVTTSRRRRKQKDHSGQKREGGEQEEVPATEQETAELEADEAASFGMEVLTIIACFTALVGFGLQFVGLRGLSFVATVAQFVAMAIMTILRTIVRRGLVTRPISQKVPADYELDWFAETFNDSSPCWMTRGSQDASIPTDERGAGDATLSSPFHRAENECQGASPPEEDHDADRMALAALRGRNALNSRCELGRLAHWCGPALEQAVLLSEALDVTAKSLLAWDRGGSTFEWSVDIAREKEVWKLPLSLKWNYDDWSWMTQSEELEGALSLWLSSTLRISHNGRGKLPSQREWLRLKRTRDIGLRLFQPSDRARSLIRDLQLWVPQCSMIIYRLQNAHNSRNTVQAPQHRVVGYLPHIGIARNRQPNEKHGISVFAKAEEFSFGGFGLPFSHSWYEPAFDPFEKSLEDKFSHHKLPDDIVGAMLDLSARNFPETANYEKSELFIALKSYDTTERLFARHVFFTFIMAIKWRHDLWEHETEIFNDDTDPEDYRVICKLRNEKLSAIAEGISATGFLGLSEAFTDVVISLSLSSMLPDMFPVLDLIQKRTKRSLLNRKFSDARQMLEELFIFALRSDLDIDPAVPRALIICQYYDYLARYMAEQSKREARGFPGEYEEMSSVCSDYSTLLTYVNCPPLIDLGSVFEGQFLVYDFKWRGVRSSVRCKMTESKCRKFNLTQNHLDAIDYEGECSPPSYLGSWQQDVFEWNPLQYLVAAGRSSKLDLVEKLAKEFQPPQYGPQRDMFGFTPLHFACSQGLIDVAETLIKYGASVQEQQEHGVSPLHLAAAFGNIYMVKLLEEARKAEIKGQREAQKTMEDQNRDLRDFNGRLPIHWAAIEGHLEIVKVLREDRHKLDLYDWTCFHLAILYEHAAVVAFLLELDTDMVNVSGSDGRKPLNLARGTANDEIIGILAAAGAVEDGGE